MKNRENELLTYAEQAVDFGASQLDQIEVYVQDTIEIGCEVNLGQMNKALKFQDSGVAVRCIIDKKIGSAFTNRLHQESIKKTVKRAIVAAKASAIDKTWGDLPTKMKFPKVSGTWDESILEKDPSVFVDLTTQMTNAIIKRDNSIIIGDAGAGGFYGWVAYANSNGVSAADRGTGAYGYADLVAPTPTGMTPTVSAIDIKRKFDIDIEDIVERSVTDVLLAKKGVKGQTGSSTIIFSARTLGELLGIALVPSLSGDNIVRGKSRLAERKGDTIATKSLTIVDDGIYPGGYGTSQFDGEGVPRQTTSLIEKGRLQSFLWDSYWAQRYGEKSTGNATRGLRSGVVSIATTNAVIPPGKPSLEDLQSEVKSGYLIKGAQGAHSSNRETGDFSIVGNPAFRIEDGELTGCVHGLMIAGNVFDLIQKVDQIASDVRNYIARGTSIIGPSIRFTDLQVVAKAD